MAGAARAPGAPCGAGGVGGGGSAEGGQRGPPAPVVCFFISGLRFEVGLRSYWLRASDVCLICI